ALAAPAAADLAAAAAAIADAQKTLALREAAVERSGSELARHRAVLAALGGLESLSVGADHAAVRAERDRSWSAHRKQLDAASAEAFEDALRRDDAATAARLSQASAVARLAEVRMAEATSAVDHAQALAAREQAVGRLAEVRGHLAAMIAEASPALPRGWSADAFAAWLKRREEALAAARERRAAEREFDAAKDVLSGVRARLAEALAAVHAPPAADATLTAMEQAADALLQKAAAMKEAGEARLKLAAAVEAKREALQRAEMAMSEWRTGFAGALAACWLAELSPPPSPAGVADMLALLASLDAALGKRAYMLDRLGKVERDMAGFAANVAEVADRLGLGTEDQPLPSYLAMQAQVDAARKAADRKADVEKQLAEMAAETPDLDALLAGADPSALDRERAALDAEIGRLKQAELEAFHARETALKALAAVGGDGRAALIEAERATVIAEMQQGGERYLRLKLGALAIREAIRRYRDAHRSSMLDTASEAFRTVSRGAYRGLAAQADGGVERLIAMAADGSSKEATELALSKGTRFQLYLALRVAGHREFARERPPLPFVLDDVMETFDDFRAEEAFRLLAGMAELGQVICLTHHRHVIEIARQVCPGARLHELAAVASDG
ncbi:MAG: hypothetical protein ACRCTI_07240, partial [Beijerinckiaceae bacterium]